MCWRRSRRPGPKCRALQPTDQRRLVRRTLPQRARQLLEQTVLVHPVCLVSGPTASASPRWPPLNPPVGKPPVPSDHLEPQVRASTAPWAKRSWGRLPGGARHASRPDQRFRRLTHRVQPDPQVVGQSRDLRLEFVAATARHVWLDVRHEIRLHWRHRRIGTGRCPDCPGQLSRPALRMSRNPMCSSFRHARVSDAWHAAFSACPPRDSVSVPCRMPPGRGR